MQKGAQYHSLLEQCKSKLQWGITSQQSEWPSSKNLQTINAGESVDKREPSCTVGGNVNWYSHYGEQYGYSLKKTRNKTTVWPNNPTAGHISWENQNWERHMYLSAHYQRNECKSKLQWSITLQQSEWPSSKSLQTIIAGETVEKMKPSSTVGGNVNWYSRYGEPYGYSFLRKTTIWPHNLTTFHSKFKSSENSSMVIEVIG